MTGGARWCSIPAANRHRSDRSDRTTTVEVGEPLVMCPIDDCAGVVFRTLLDKFARHVHVHHLSRPVNALCQLWRQEHGPSPDPLARVHEQIPDRPCIVADEKVLYMPDFAVLRVDVIASDLMCAAEMLVPGGAAGGVNRRLGRRSRLERCGTDAPLERLAARSVMRFFEEILLPLPGSERS